YYCGSEDHDFEEINHIHVFNQKLEWKSKPGYAVGKMSLNEIPEFFETLLTFFSNSEQANQFLNKNLQWIRQSEKYVDYYRHFVNELFGSYGLLFFNPDDKDAKTLFSPVIKQELLQIGMKKFESVGGTYFKKLSFLIGFEKAMKLKATFEKIKSIIFN
ncbi:MAG: bacillithiol biosynthesis BshC, partial [Ignavibacteria bacterium]|nr:bacillithiol biosynthesis BshC [Ignavibacteria bacterium]